MLGGGEQVHRHEPVQERHLAVLNYRARLQRPAFPAVVAAVPAFFLVIVVVRAAALGAYHAALLTLFAELLYACFLVGEVLVKV